MTICRYDSLTTKYKHSLHHPSSSLIAYLTDPPSHTNTHRSHNTVSLVLVVAKQCSNSTCIKALRQQILAIHKSIVGRNMCFYKVKLKASFLIEFVLLNWNVSTEAANVSCTIGNVTLHSCLRLSLKSNLVFAIQIHFIAPPQQQVVEEERWGVDSLNNFSCF